MKSPNMIIIAAAALITSISLGASTHFNFGNKMAPTAQIHGLKVIDLAPVIVHPSSDDRRAALLTLVATQAPALLATLTGPSSMNQGTEAFSLIGSELAMPYYSFGDKLGRISKE